MNRPRRQSVIPLRSVDRSRCHSPLPAATRLHYDDAESPRVDDERVPPESDTPTGTMPCSTTGSTGALAEVDAPRQGGRARVDPVEDRGRRGHDPDATQADLEARDARGSGEASPRGYLPGGRVDAQHLIVALACAENPDRTLPDGDRPGLAVEAVIARAAGT